MRTIFFDNNIIRTTFEFICFYTLIQWFPYKIIDHNIELNISAGKRH